MASTRNTSTTSKTTAPAVVAPVGLENFEANRATWLAKFRGETDHSTPNLAAIVRATRQSLGDISQMQLGRNENKTAGSKLDKSLTTPASLASSEKGHKKSGWFSLVANVEQGGRKTAIPAEFVTYLAAVAQLDESVVQSAVDEDKALAAASTAANAPTA
jgi:hypothetical protein